MARVIVSISLPKDLNLEIEKKVRRGFYSSKSEYVRKAIREALIWEAEITKREKKNIAEALKDAKEGRVSRIFNRREAIRYLRSL